MSVIVAPSFTIAPGVDGLNADSPIVGYHNLVTAANVSAITEDTLWPASNLANPSTYLKWRSGMGSPSTDEYVTVELNTSDDVDYLAIAGHNLGSSQATLSVEGNSEDIGSPANWFELIAERLISNDRPALFRFTQQPLAGIRLRIQDSLAATPATPYIAVMYVGKLLTLQRRIFDGHTPMPYGRRLSVANHRSISGAFLGRVVLSESTETSIQLKNITGAWYRTYMDPFLIAAKTDPFFFAWRPSTHSDEVGFAWLTEDPQVVNQRGVRPPSGQTYNGLMQVDLRLGGIAT